VLAVEILTSIRFGVPKHIRRARLALSLKVNVVDMMYQLEDQFNKRDVKGRE
jgi:hypothetical protein